MNPEIVSLQSRLQQGGDWRAFRDEIAGLHEKARSEEEYVALLEAHRELVAVAKYCFDEETYNKLIPITKAEYNLFLSKEATENGTINPVLLDRITRREVTAGRLNPDDGLRMLAKAGASILGDSAEITAHRCKHGDWLFFGATAGAVLAVPMVRANLSPLWLVLVALVAGWLLNYREQLRIKAAIARSRA